MATGKERRVLLRQTNESVYTTQRNGRPRAEAGQATSAGGSVEHVACIREVYGGRATSAEDHSADLLVRVGVMIDVTGHQNHHD